MQLALKAADRLARGGIDVEVVDLRTVKPMDKQIVLKSVEKTGKLVIADVGWKTCGFSAEISALMAEDLFDRGLCLPSGTAMTNSDLDRVVTTIKHRCQKQSHLPISRQTCFR